LVIKSVHYQINFGYLNKIYFNIYMDILMVNKYRIFRAGTSKKNKRQRSKSSNSSSIQKTKKRIRVNNSPTQSSKTRRRSKKSNIYARQYKPAVARRERGHVLRLSTKDATPAEISRLLAEGWVQDERRLRGSIIFRHPEREAMEHKAKKKQSDSGLI
jgi:hypothetical protein